MARLDYYADDELAAILKRVATILGVELESDGADEIASRSRERRGSPNRLLKRVRDYAEVRADGRVTAAVARDALALFEVDELGLDKVDRAILDALCRTFVGRAVGLGTLAIAVSEAPETVEDVYEPFLLLCGLIERTPRGASQPRPASPISVCVRRPSRARLPSCSKRRTAEPTGGEAQPGVDQIEVASTWSSFSTKFATASRTSRSRTARPTHSRSTCSPDSTTALDARRERR